MQPDQWIWVYRDTAHGYYDTPEEAEEAMREALHPTRQPKATVVRLKVDQSVNALLHELVRGRAT